MHKIKDGKITRMVFFIFEPEKRGSSLFSNKNTYPQSSPGKTTADALIRVAIINGTRYR